MFAIVLLSGKLHFVPEHTVTPTEYFYTTPHKQKTNPGTTLNPQTYHQHQASIYIQTYKTDKKCKNPTMVSFVLQLLLLQKKQAYLKEET